MYVDLCPLSLGAGHFWDKGGVGVGRNAGHDVGTLNQEGEEGNEEDEEDMGEEEDDEYEENEVGLLFCG